jgi:thiamine pyrophosphokinase
VEITGDIDSQKKKLFKEKKKAQETMSSFPKAATTML